MLISELPQDYKDLIPPKSERRDPDTDALNNAFAWGNTKEGMQFWIKCFKAKTAKDLPTHPDTLRKMGAGFHDITHEATDYGTKWKAQVITNDFRETTYSVISANITNCGMIMLKSFSSMEKEFLEEHKEGLLNFFKRAAHSYPYAIATHNHHYDHLFYGWKQIHEFKNPNSGNLIHVWRLNVK